MASTCKTYKSSCLNVTNKQASLLFKQRLVLHITLYQNLSSTLLPVFNVYYIAPPPKARNMIFIISNLSKMQWFFVVHSWHNVDILSAPKILLLRITAQGGQKTKARPSCYVTQSLSESLQQATLSFSQNQSS